MSYNKTEFEQALFALAKPSATRENSARLCFSHAGSAGLAQRTDVGAKVAASRMEGAQDVRGNRRASADGSRRVTGNTKRPAMSVKGMRGWMVSTSEAATATGMDGMNEAH